MGMERKSGSGNGKYGKLWAKVKVKGDEELNRTEQNIGYSMSFCSFSCIQCIIICLND